MNRLQLAQRLRQESGISGTGPVTSAGATGQTKELFDRIDEAWIDIQTMSHWDWMWERATIVLPAGQSVTAATGVPASRYVIDSMKAAPNPGRLAYSNWRQFSDIFEDVGYGEGTPTVWSVRPDTAIVVNSIAPAGDVQLSVERYANPVPFTQDTDVPALPVQYHMAIVWLALLRIAAFDEASSRYATANREYNLIMQRLAAEHGPSFEMGEPLA